MKRRELIKGIALVPAVGLGFRMPLAQAAEYAGRLFVFVQAEGAWDPTSFCDPKQNVPGERPINNWSNTGEPGQAGNLRYAPFAANQAFFDKYYNRMLVINGVDAQTNSHTVGVLHSWSGRNSAGFPTMTSLLAADNGPELAMPYLNFGGFADTAGVVRYTRIDDPSTIVNIAYPNVNADNVSQSYLNEADWQLLQATRDARLGELEQQPALSPRAARNRGFYRSALTSADDLTRFADMIPPPEELQQRETQGNLSSTLKRQAQVALLAFKAGVTVSADLYLRGFDTHQNHDADQAWLLGNLTDSVDYLWDYAEELELADRLVVVMTSDFGRTPFYNADAGKDHWPIGSVVVMEKNQPWTNRVIGETDEGHNAYNIDPATLTRDDVNGTHIYPKHVHKALRDHVGLAASPIAARFPFNNTEDFAFFG